MILNHCFKAGNLILVVALMTGLGHITHASAQEYSVLVDLNSRKATPIVALGDSYARAYGINDSGQLAGTFGTDVAFRAFITGPDGTGIRDLGDLGWGSSFAYGINEAGQVVGQSWASGGYWHAFVTGPDGKGMRDLGTLGGDFIVAYGINDVGQVVGSDIATGAGGSRAFITGPQGMGMRDLGNLGFSGSSYAFGINNAGQVVGQSDPATGWSHAFITGPDGMAMRDLGTLGGVISRAADINDAGQVVGSSYTGGPDDPFGPHAFITGPDGTDMRDLGTLGGSSSEANGINDAGQVAGVSDTADGVQHAFVTGPAGIRMTDLNSLVDLPDGVILTRAMGINNVGQVIAMAIPEPETYTLMLAGLVLLGFIGQRKTAENPRQIRACL